MKDFVPSPFHIPLSRRRLVGSLVTTGAGLWVPGAFAELLALTPRLTEGPYYPDKLPLNQDNDLVRLTDDVRPAIGTVTNLSGRLLDREGKPLKGALIELWQADNEGCYIHSNGEQRGKRRDANFQGYGKFETASDGGWRFRTIKPGLYTGRTRHYHFAVTLAGQSRRFTTQLMFEGEPGNAGDMVLNSLSDAAQRAAVTRPFQKIAGTKELTATWDIVMGLTPGDGHDDPPPPRPPGGKGGAEGTGGADRRRPPRGERPPGPPPDRVR